MSTIHHLTVPAATRPALRWLASFVGFPLGGLAAMVLVGPVDSRPTAVLGGLVTGAVLGVVQAWALGPLLGADRRTAGAWVTATAIGLAAGLTLGSGLVDFGTGAGDLAVQGLASGALVGLAQSLVLRGRIGRLAALWPAYLAGAWALGWTVTTAAGVQVEDQFTVFGAAGALTVAALTTVLPVVLRKENS
jgi:hypothetical protein